MAIDARKGAKKWARRVAGAQEDYVDGVTNPIKDWGKETMASEARYKEGVTKAAQEGRFGKGVAKAGTKKWQTGAILKGPGRWVEGVAGAEDSQAEGFAPYADVINKTVLPTRYPRGDVRNIERVKVLAMALADKKKALRT